MNAAWRPTSVLELPLHQLLLASIAPTPCEYPGPEALWLRDCSAQVGEDPRQALSDWLSEPPEHARRMLELAAHLGLHLTELVALSLAVAVEADPMLGRVLAWLQAPLAGSRPSLGLINRMAHTLGIGDAMGQIWEGSGRASGLLRLDGETRPLPEVCVHVAIPMVLALQGRGRLWPGVTLEGLENINLSESVQAEAARQAQALTDEPALVVRCGHPREARAVCVLIIKALGCEAAFMDSEIPQGLGPWLWLVGAVPVVCVELAPGDAFSLPRLPGYDGPVLVAAGPEGSYLHDGCPLNSWRVPLPNATERARLWQHHLNDPALSRDLGHHRRTGAFHIHIIGQSARHLARLQGAQHVDGGHVFEVLQRGFAGELGTLAEPVSEVIVDEALVLSPALRTELLALKQRCRVREGLADDLGPSIQSRYRPGVRALLVGASGTGKTLAAGWLASQLGLPLYRVDVAATTSKYIGETEKNLAQLFARAEQSEVVLLFDEADSLFGKRTDVKDSNDRFANTQTNYLLQRIESFDGIALLTSNSRARFDPAFTRRLDAILDFPMPTPEERRRLWLAHLGAFHALDAAMLNRLSSQCDLAGGHIRNAVLVAAVMAQGAGRPIGDDDLLVAIAAEYRKLGKQVPAGLSAPGTSAWG